MFGDWTPSTDYVDQHAPGHARDDLMGEDLEGHLNRDHGYRLTSLMGEDYETRERLHDAEHDLMDGKSPNFCPNCGHDLR